jgi:hypothetical protein
MTRKNEAWEGPVSIGAGSLRLAANQVDQQ